MSGNYTRVGGDKRRARLPGGDDDEDEDEGTGEATGTGDNGQA